MAAIGPVTRNSIVRSMKRFGLSPYFAAATLFLGGTASDLQAQANAVPAAPSATSDEKNPVAEYMKRLEPAGDSSLSEAERAAATEILMKESAAAPASRGFPPPGAGREGPEQFKQRM